MVELEMEPGIWILVQVSYTNNTMFFSIFWTKLLWSQSKKSQDVGAGAKKLDAWSWSLKFEYQVHSPG